MDYEKDMKIDRNALDLEVLNQPTLAVKYGQYWAEMQKKATQTEEYVKLVKAELTKDILSDPEKYIGKDVKITGPIIEACYRTHPRHKKAKERWVLAQYNLHMAEISKKEISITRRNSLEQLITLHGQHYFAGPSVPMNINREEIGRQVQKDVDLKIARKMKRNRNKE